MYLSPRKFKFLLNLYGPYLGAGVKIDSISKDWTSMNVSMNLRWYNRNAMGVHFGGSLYSMTDPHLVLMHMQLLGSDYTVWDKSAGIEFLRPAKGKVTAEFSLDPEEIDELKSRLDDGKTEYPRYTIEIRNEKGKAVARVNKELYIKRKHNG